MLFFLILMKKYVSLIDTERFQVEVLKKERAALSTRVQELFDENERLRKQVLASV